MMVVLKVWMSLVMVLCSGLVHADVLWESDALVVMIDDVMIDDEEWCRLND